MTVDLDADESKYVVIASVIERIEWKLRWRFDLPEKKVLIDEEVNEKMGIVEIRQRRLGLNI